MHPMILIQLRMKRQRHLLPIPNRHNPILYYSQYLNSIRNIRHIRRADKRHRNLPNSFKLCFRVKTPQLPILHTATGAPEMHDYKNTQWLYDASYLRCKQLQLSYTLPKRWISKLGMSQCQIFVNGENLFTISPLKMFDPEIDLSSTNLMQYPSLRTINFGFNITF